MISNNLFWHQPFCLYFFLTIFQLLTINSHSGFSLGFYFYSLSLLCRFSILYLHCYWQFSFLNSFWLYLSSLSFIIFTLAHLLSHSLFIFFFIFSLLFRFFYSFFLPSLFSSLSDSFLVFFFQSHNLLLTYFLFNIVSLLLLHIPLSFLLLPVSPFNIHHHSLFNLFLYYTFYTLYSFVSLFLPLFSHLIQVLMRTNLCDTGIKIESTTSLFLSFVF